MGHYDEFYEAEDRRRAREERDRRLKIVVTTDQMNEYHRRNAELERPARPVGFLPTQPQESPW